MKMIFIASGFFIIMLLLLLCGVTKSGGNTPQPPPPSKDWQNILNDDFTGNKINNNNWKIYTDPDPTHGCSIYTDKQGTVSVYDSNLVLSLKPAPNKQGVYSGRVRSKLKVSPNNYVEARVKMANYSNLGWPAFWLVPEGDQGKYGKWPLSGEIDILESVNGHNHNATTLHCQSSGDKCHGPSPNDGIPAGPGKTVDFSQYHTFGCKWFADRITFHLDANGPDDANDSNKIGDISAEKWKCCWENMNQNSPAPFDGPMNIIINLAIGGDWASNVDGNGGKCMCDKDANHKCVSYTRCPTCFDMGLDTNMKMMVDWVRVWKKK